MEQVGYRHILVPVDGSKNSFKAVRHAAYLAGCCTATVHLLHVATLYKNIPVYTQLSTSYVPAWFYDDVEKFGRQVLDEAGKLLGAVPHQTFLETGSPVEVIPEFAATHGSDLIVIGSRGLGPLKGLVMGSVSTHVVHHAPCPVLVVR